MWVAIAGLVLSLILGGIIMANIIKPLNDLIFPAEVKVPKPDGAVERDHIEDSKTADEEWLYSVEGDACQIAWFFEQNGGTCNFMPTMCKVDENDVPTLNTNQPDALTAQCSGGESSEVTGYSWEVMVSTGGTSNETYYRVFLYK